MSKKQLNKHLTYLVLLVMFLQGFAIYSLYCKAYNPTNKRVFNSLGKQLLFKQEKLGSSIEGTLVAFRKKVKKEKRGGEYLEAAEKIKKGSFKLIPNIDNYFSSNNIDSLLNALAKNEETLIGTFPDEEQKILRDKLITINNHEKQIQLLSKLPVYAKPKVINNIKINVLKNTGGIIDELFGKVGSYFCGYSKFEVSLIPYRTKLFRGEILETKIYLAKSTTLIRTKITANNQGLKLNKYGIATYQFRPTKLGAQIVTGKVTLLMSGDSIVVYPFEKRYNVIAPCN